MAEELGDVWEKYRHSYSDRLLMIEQAITALRQGEMTQLQRFEAEQEAHTLIGSLGSFGADIALYQAKVLGRNRIYAAKLGEPEK